MKSHSAARSKKQLANSEDLSSRDQVKECLLQVMKKHTGAKKTRQLTTVMISLASPSKPLNLNRSVHDHCKPYAVRQQEQRSIEERPKPPLSRSHDAERVISRWQKQSWAPQGVDGYLAIKSTSFRKVKYNIYILQRSALQIQHWYFKKKLAIEKAKEALASLQQWGSTAVSNHSYQRVQDDITKTLQEKELNYLKKEVAKRISPSTPSPGQKLPNSHIKIAKITPQAVESPMKELRLSGSRNLGYPVGQDLSNALKKLEVKIENSEDSKNTLGISSFEFSILPSKEPTLTQMAKPPETMHQSMITPQKTSLHIQAHNSAIEKFNSMGKSIEEQTYYNKRVSPLNTHASFVDSQRAGKPHQPIAFRPSKELQDAINGRENKAKVIFENFAREREFMNKKKGSQHSLEVSESRNQEEDKKIEETVQATKIQWVPLRSPRPLTTYGSTAQIQRGLSTQREVSRNTLSPPKAKTQTLKKQSPPRPTHHRQSPWFDVNRPVTDSSKTPSPLVSLSPQRDLTQVQPSSIFNALNQQSLQASPGWKEESKLLKEPKFTSSPMRLSPQRLKFQKDGPDEQPEEVFTLRNSIDLTPERAIPKQTTLQTVTQSPNPLPQRKSPSPIMQERKSSILKALASPHVQSRKSLEHSPVTLTKSTSIGKSLNAILKQKLQRLNNEQQSREKNKALTGLLTQRQPAPKEPMTMLSKFSRTSLKHSLEKIKPTTKLQRESQDNSSAAMLSTTIQRAPKASIDSQPKANSVRKVNKLTDYKRIQKRQEKPRETPMTALPQPEKKPVLLAAAPTTAPRMRPVGEKRSSVFEILKRNKSFEKLEPLALLTINTQLAKQKREQYEKLRTQNRSREGQVESTTKVKSKPSVERSVPLTFEEFKVLQYQQNRQNRGNLSSRASISRTSHQPSSPYMKTLMTSYVQSSVGGRQKTDHTPPRISLSRNQEGSLSASKRHNFNPQRSSMVSRVSFNEESLVARGHKKQPSKVFTPILSGGDTPDRDGSLGSRHLMSTDSFSSKRRERHVLQSVNEVSLERQSVLTDALQRSNIVVNNSLQS